MLRLRAKFSRTLRRYGRLLRSPPERWSDLEVEAADKLVRRLETQGAVQRASILLSGCPVDQDADVWVDGVDVARQLSLAVDEECGGDEGQRQLMQAVAERLQEPFHLPAVREALGCLVPEHLHPRLDGKKPRGLRREGGEHIGVHLEADRWRVDVSEEACLQSETRALSGGTLEFFLKVVGRICEKLDVPVAVGSTALGRRIGDGETVAHLLQTVRGWKQWTQQERERVFRSKLFMVPVCWDPGAEQKQDWLLAEVIGSNVADAAVGSGCDVGSAEFEVGEHLPTLEGAERLRFRIHDALGRDQSVPWMLFA